MAYLGHINLVDFFIKTFQEDGVYVQEKRPNSGARKKIKMRNVMISTILTIVLGLSIAIPSFASYYKNANVPFSFGDTHAGFSLNNVDNLAKGMTYKVVNDTTPFKVGENLATVSENGGDALTKKGFKFKDLLPGNTYLIGYEVANASNTKMNLGVNIVSSDTTPNDVGTHINPKTVMSLNVFHSNSLNGTYTKLAGYDSLSDIDPKDNVLGSLIPVTTENQKDYIIFAFQVKDNGKPDDNHSGDNLLMNTTLSMTTNVYLEQPNGEIVEGKDFLVQDFSAAA